jgi:hypothetical protein
MQIVRIDNEPIPPTRSSRFRGRLKFFNAQSAMNWVALQMLTGDKATRRVGATGLTEPNGGRK